MKHAELTEVIIHCYYKVYNTLGHGFLEKVYEKALMIELRNNGLKALRQNPIEVFYEEELVGEYFADIVVEDIVILELKAVKKLADEHEAQLYNYLKATNIEVGLLLNFGTKAEFSRKIFDNEYKK